MRTFRTRSLAVAAGLALPLSALAQPAATDLGPITLGGPLVSAAFPDVPVGSVTWFTFTTSQPISYTNLRWLDIYNTTGTGTGGSSDSEIALYDSVGNLIVVDDDDGPGTSSAQSFGTGSGLFPLATGSPVVSNGRDGDLPAGTYYVGVSHFSTVWGSTNWTITTPSSTLLYASSINVQGANLTPPAAPASTIDLGTLALGTPVNRTDPLAAAEVKWYRIVVPSPIDPANATFLDMDTEGTALSPTNATRLSVYTVSGALAQTTTVRPANTTVTLTDTTDGSGSLSQLTFGLTTPVRPAVGTGLAYDGRDGNLRLGTYYVAVAGPGSAPSVTAASGTAFGHTSASSNTGTITLNILADDVVTPPSGSGVAVPTFAQVGTSATVRVTVTPGGNPVSTGITVSLDASQAGAGTITLLDDGTGGDVTAGDNIFSAVINVPGSATPGTYTLPFTVADLQGRSTTGNVNFTVVGTPPACPSGSESFAFTGLVSDGPVGDPTNGVQTFNAVGTSPVTMIRLTGRYVPNNAFGAEARLRLVLPGGQQVDVRPVPTSGPSGVPVDFAIDIPVNCGGSAAGSYTLTAFESGNDAGVDGTYANVCVALDTTAASGTVYSADFCGTDAGELPGTALVPAGSGTLSTITGRFNNTDADMYQINICNPAAFSASLVGGTFADTQLFLFDANGVGVIFNDDVVTGTTPQSTIDNSGGQIVAPGTYYIAASVYNRDPVDAANALLWVNTPFIGIRTPNGPGAANPVAGWTGTTTIDATYVLTLAGVCYPGGGGGGCNLADITEVGGTEEAPGNPDQQLTVDDLILFVNLFSSQTGCPGTAPCNRADVTGIGGGGAAPDGELTVDDLIEFVNAFSTGC